MIITNIKVFNNACKVMEKFCKLSKGDKEKLFHNVFFMDKNLMCSTNGKFLAIRNMSDCVINTETFAFPCNLKPIKFVTMDGEKLIIESRREDYFSNDKKEVMDFNWKRVVPTNPKIEKIYDFSDHNFTLPYDDKSVVIFHENGEVEFKYNDNLDIIATYGDVQSDKDSMFEVENKNIAKVSFPMTNIMNILKLSKKFIYQEFDGDNEHSYSARVFIIKDYKFIVMPMRKGLEGW